MAVVLKKDDLGKTVAPKETKGIPIKDLVVKARFVRQTPDKLRLAAKVVKGKKIDEALNILRFTSKAAAKPLSIFLKSALAQVKDKGMNNEVIIKTIVIDEGPKLKRRRIIHRGRATAILKRRSHITVVLSADGNSKFKRPKGAQSGS